MLPSAAPSVRKSADAEPLTARRTPRRRLLPSEDSNRPENREAVLTALDLRAFFVRAHSTQGGLPADERARVFRIGSIATLAAAVNWRDLCGTHGNPATIA